MDEEVTIIDSKTRNEKIKNFLYSHIEWRALNYVNLDNQQSKKIIEILSMLEELDDVQNVYSNASIIN